MITRTPLRHGLPKTFSVRSSGLAGSVADIQVKRRLQFRFDFDSTRRSGHHDSVLMKARIHTRRHFTSEVCESDIPTSTVEGCYSMLTRQRECHSYYRDIH